MKKTIFILGLFTTITSNAQFNSVKKIVPTKNIEKTVDEKPKTVATNKTTTQAENPSSGYNGKAKVFVDKFWILVEDLKKSNAGNSEGKVPSYKIILDKAKVQLKYVKEKDPSYDVTAMEQVLKPYEEGLTTYFQEKKDAVQSQLNNNDKNGDGVAGLFMGSSTTEIVGTGDTEADVAKHKEQIKAYNEKVEKVIASSPSNIASIEYYIKNSVKSDKERIIKTELEINKAKGIGTLFNYRELIGIEAYWNAAKRILTNVPEAAEVQQLAAAALQRVGTEEQVRAKIEAKRLELIKNKKMPVAVKKDANIEQKFKTDFSKILANSPKYNDETIIKINIIDNDWTTVRNQYTGIIVGRAISAAIATKKADGRYFVYDFVNYLEEYNGSTYVNGKCDHGYKWPQEILLENIK